MEKTLSAMGKGKTVSRRTICAYGFDKAGFEIPTDGETSEFRIEWVPFRDPRRLDDADGVILVQGIFEDIEYIDSFYGHGTHRVTHEKDLMLEREQQVLNVLRRGDWVCFLVRDIVDAVRSDRSGNRTSIAGTDLCK